MNALLALLIRQGLAACGGFFAANNITGSSTTSIIIGLVMLAIPTVWSWVAKCIHLEDNSRSGWIENSEILRTLVGSIVSQGVTALSVYFATDANNPELLGIAVANAAASKFGLQQKLAFIGTKDAVNLFLLSFLSASLISCASFTKQDAKDAGAQIGLAAADAAILIARMQLSSAESELSAAATQPGAERRVIIAKQFAVVAARRALDEAERAIAKQRAKAAAKQPQNVQPVRSGDESSPSTTGIKGDESSPLPNDAPSITIPRYGAQVAEALKTNPSGSTAEAVSSGQSRACGLLNHSPLRGAPNCAACHAGSSAKRTATVSLFNGLAPALVAR
jgi:hypothetical protein